MDKLSEYIPFLILIVWGIISLARKTKQPGKDASLPEEAFPTIPELIINYEEPVPIKKIVTPVTPKVKISTPGENRQVVHEKPVEIQDVVEQEFISIDFSDPEEIKKAIIYSEIFNKKDF
jgi:hypothetical protein